MLPKLFTATAVGVEKLPIVNQLVIMFITPRCNNIIMIIMLNVINNS